MSSLEALQLNAAVRGILPDCLVTVVSVQWFGSEALELTYKNPTGRVANELLYRHDEARLEVVEQGRPWSFHGTVTLDPTRAGRDASKITDEVITHLVGLMGSAVRVTLEIDAEIPAGVPDNVVRTVTENSRTLKFTSHGFESE